MKILFIHNRYKLEGGEDTAVALEIQLLREKGHEAELLEFNNDEIGAGMAKAAAALKAFYNRESAGRLKEKLKTFHADIIHVHNLFFTASASVLYEAARLKIPVVMTLHNYRLICANGLLLRDNHICELCVNKTFPVYGVKYRCYRDSAAESALVTAVTGVHKLTGAWTEKVDHFIALTDFAKDKFLHSSYSPDPEKTSVIPNYVPDHKLRGIPRGDHFLYVGRLSKEKGVNSLLGAFLKTPAQNLVIAGDGPERNELEQKSEGAGNISFVGKQEKKQVLELMEKARALIFPSVCYEGLPFTIAEAFSTGTPVIASRLGGMKEMVRDGLNGYHFTAGDSDALCEALNRFDSNENMGSMYEAARQTYLDNYNANTHFEAIFRLYKSVIAKNKSDV
ncbi:MAG: glycosyltransferase family 4 protein [Gemmatimonadaceae bacterium]|nr:glycosyltransferase family 4 protein [Chitinophagaceae bacterium]